MSKEELTGRIEAANQETAQLDYQRMQLARQIEEAQRKVGDIALRIAYLNGRAEVYVEMMGGEETPATVG